MGYPALAPRRTAFLEIPNRRAIALIGISSARCNRRISAQSSTLITLHRVTEGVHFHPPIRGQFSPDADKGHRLRPCPAPRLAHRQGSARALAGAPRRTRGRPTARQGHWHPRPTQTKRQLTGPARAAHQQGASASLYAIEPRTARTAAWHTRWAPAEASAVGATPNDETPGRITSGREFRATETGNSGDYARVGSSRKSSTC